jgi:hypothetical protein
MLSSMSGLYEFSYICAITIKKLIHNNISYDDIKDLAITKRLGRYHNSYSIIMITRVPTPISMR